MFKNGKNAKTHETPRIRGAKPRTSIFLPSKDVCTIFFKCDSSEKMPQRNYNEIVSNVYTQYNVLARHIGVVFFKWNYADRPFHSIESNLVSSEL